ncbi:MAG: DeoR/GlpR family DNA-binding transcription regulator [Thermodesulfobacteriota bacterium]
MTEGEQKKIMAGRSRGPQPALDGDGKSATVRNRHARILEAVREQGFVTIETLANRFDVTPQTIRRDIQTLSDEGLLHRYHGGAANTLSTENVSYPERRVLCLHEKQKIAQALVQHIPNHSSLFINIGTTTEAVAEALCRHRGLRVITNNLNVAAILSKNEGFEIIVTGGLVRSRDGGIIGEAAIDFIRQFKVDFGIIGISGIDLDGTLLDFDYREVRAARAIIDNSRSVFLAADHTKFGRNAMVRLGNLDEIDALFTDRHPPSALTDYLANTETRLHVVGEDG